MKNKTILIVGNATGTPKDQYKKEMNIAELLLSVANFNVINPIKIVGDEVKPDKVYELLRPQLLKSDFIFFMKDYKQCPIARNLHDLAVGYNLEIVYYEQMNALQWAS